MCIVDKNLFFFQFLFFFHLPAEWFERKKVQRLIVDRGVPPARSIRVVNTSEGG